MAFNVVYSDKDRIQGAIESGVIPRESLVLTSDDAKRSEMYYYDDATTPTFAGKDAMFTAIVKEGYIFRGWYSDEECTTFISSNNPLSIATPSVNKESADPQDGETTTSELILYARARSITGRSDMLYFKVNGSYKSATRVYKKVSGTWVEQTDLPTIFSGGSNGTASNYVYGGSV